MDNSTLELQRPPGPVPSYDYDDSSKLLMIVILSLLSLMAILGNLLQFLAVMLDRCLQTTSNFFILSLGCSDFVVGFWTLPTIAISVSHKEWMFGGPLCQLSAFIDSLVIMASMWTLGFTSVDRLMLVKSPINYKSKMSKTNARRAIVMIWVISGLTSVPPLLGWSNYGFSLYSMSCAMGSVEVNFEDPHHYYFLFYVLMVFPAPVLMIIVSYSKIFLFAIKKPTISSLPNLRTAKITFLLIMFVLACILPTFIIGMIFWWGWRLPVTHITSKIVIWSLLGNSAFNPILYGWVNTQFRNVYKRMLLSVILRQRYSVIRRSGVFSRSIVAIRSKHSSIKPVNLKAARLLGWTTDLDSK